MGITKVQAPQKQQGGGFLDILGKVMQIGTGAAMAISTAGASAPLTVAQLAQTGAAVAGGVGAAKSLVSPPSGPTPQVEPSATSKISDSSMQEVSSPSKILQEAIQSASQIPEYQSQVPMMQDALKTQQRRDYLAMRRGGY